MQISKISLFILLLVVLLVPQMSFAYFTIDQKAMPINENYIAYTISYRFSNEKSDLRMPVGAVRGLQFGDSSTYLGYELLNEDDKVVSQGKTSGLVFSDAKIVNNEYQVPKGEISTFTLLVLLNRENSSISTEEDLSLKLTSLPFKMTKDNETTSAKLNPSELQYYITPGVTFKK